MQNNNVQKATRKWGKRILQDCAVRMGENLGKLREHVNGTESTTNLIDCRTVSLCSAAFTLIFSSLMSLFSRSIWAL